MHTKLPKMTIDTNCISMLAERRGLYCMEGAPKPYQYITDNKELIIVSTSNGYLKVKHKDIPQIVEELKEMYWTMTDNEKSGRHIVYRREHEKL